MSTFLIYKLEKNNFYYKDKNYYTYGENSDNKDDKLLKEINLSVENNFFNYTDTSSIISRKKIINETFLINNTKKNLFNKIKDIVFTLKKEEPMFNKLSNDKINNFLTNIKENYHDELKNIDDDELYIRIKKALSIELLYGLIDDFIDDELDRFNSSIKRRKLF